MKLRKRIQQKTKALLQKEIDSTCPFCPSKDVGHFEFHHIDENPSNNDLINLLMVCPTCHSKITKRDIQAEEVLIVKRKISRVISLQLKKPTNGTIQKIIGDDIVPELLLSFEGVFNIVNSDNEIAIFLDELQFRIENSITPLCIIGVKEEEFFRKEMIKYQIGKTIGDRKQRLQLNKILIAIAKLKEEFTERISIFLSVDLYPIKYDYILLANTLKEIFKLSIAPNKLIEETDFIDYFDSKMPKEKPHAHDGDIPMAACKPFDNNIYCKFSLTNEEFEELIKKSPVKVDKKEIIYNMSFLGFECSDLSKNVLARKVIPSFVDKIHSFKYLQEIINVEDNISWKGLPNYILSID
jgi:hypothetical protein